MQFDTTKRGNGFKDNTGEKFGRLSVIKLVGKTAHKKMLWECKCDCGNTCVVSGNLLRRGHTRSCGCLKDELTSKRFTKHGHRGRVYQTWKNMRSRCGNKNNPQFHLYGGRGIKVCERWNDYLAFWTDIGQHWPGKEWTLDRFPDRNGNYEPGNVRWATATMQARNTRRNRIVEFNGEAMCVSEVAEKTGVHYSTIYSRMKTKRKLIS